MCCLCRPDGETVETVLCSLAVWITGLEPGVNEREDSKTLRQSNVKLGATRSPLNSTLVESRM
jgi:hypothetical protein